MEVHKENETKVTESGYRQFLCNSPLIETAESKSKSLNILVKTDPKTNQFIFSSEQSKSFICNSQGENEPLLGYGSFHIRYEVTDKTGSVKLMALSVVDVLPTGLSSVYFIYDTDFKSFSPGILTSLI